MKKLICFILLLLFLHDFSSAQTKLDGTYMLTTHGKQEYFDEFCFTGDGMFKFRRLKYLANECGMGSFSVNDSLLTFTFLEVPFTFKDSLRSYYTISESKVNSDDTCEYLFSVVDHNNNPVFGTSAQLVDENGYNVVYKIKKNWEVDSKGEAAISFPAGLEFYGIKIANKGYETVIIPVKKDTNETITVNLLELEKCVHVIDGGTEWKFYLKNVRYSGFYMREENSADYKYFKKEKE